MSYKINNLYINNFKAFDFNETPIKIGFSDDDRAQIIDLFVLTGPNGYGKTSIFQAIELALTGSVEIIDIKDSSKKFIENSLCNKVGKESLIALELIDNKLNCITIVRYNENVTGEKVSNSAKNYKLYILKHKFKYEQFKEDILNIDDSTQEQLINILGDFIKSFWLHYIKQEQTANFLFKTSNERITSINNIVDIEKKKSTEFIDEKINDLDEEIENIYNELVKLKKIYLIKQDNSIGEKPKGFKIFKEHKYEWDKEEYNLDEDLESYDQTISNLIYISKNYNQYIEFNKHSYCKKMLKNKELLKGLIIYNCYNEKYDDLYRKNQEILHLQKILKNKNKDVIKIEYLSEESSVIAEMLNKKIEKLNSLSDVKSNIYTVAEDLRNITSKNKKEFISIFNSDCPLCGKNYESGDVLIDQIKSHNLKFNNIKNFISNEIKEIQDEIKEICIKINEVIVKIKNSKYYNPEALSYLEEIKDKNSIDSIIKEIELFDEKLGISIKQFIKTDEDTVEHIYINIEKYMQIQSMEYELGQNESIDENLIYEFDKYKRNLINSDCLELLEKKKTQMLWYINKMEIERNSKIVKKHKELKEVYKNNLIKKNKLSIIKNAINSGEKKYKEELIRYIKIPLYIYSGKLLQTHQNGLGVFCDTGNKKDELTKIKFVTSANSDQDLITKFSAGQISILTIASLLAFRKITDTDLNILMIDDPCQTMDELNIASLTEILKNEFEDTQILLSTHEDNIAGYMMYKYYKNKKSYKYFNVKNELYKV